MQAQVFGNLQAAFCQAQIAVFEGKVLPAVLRHTLKTKVSGLDPVGIPRCAGELLGQLAQLLFLPGPPRGAPPLARVWARSVCIVGVGPSEQGMLKVPPLRTSSGDLLGSSRYLPVLPDQPHRLMNMPATWYLTVTGSAPRALTKRTKERSGRHHGGHDSHTRSEPVFFPSG